MVTAGNQFGTVHALVGPAAFERSDRLIAQLIGMGGDSADDRANGVTRAATPMRSARGFGEGNSNGLTMFGGYFNNRSRIDCIACAARAGSATPDKTAQLCAIESMLHSRLLCDPIGVPSSK